MAPRDKYWSDRPLSLTASASYSLHMSQEAHPARTNPISCSMKQLRIFLLLLGFDGTLSQGFPPAIHSPVLMYIPWWREVLLEESVLSKNTTQCPWPGLKPRLLQLETGALSIREATTPLKCRLYLYFHFHCI